MAEKIVFAQLNLDIDPLIKQTKEVKKELDILKANQKELTKEGQTSSKQFVENAASIKILSTAYNNNVKAITANVKTAATQAQADELINDVLSRQVTTIQEAREQNKALNAIRNSVNATTTEGQKQIQRLNNALDANNDFIKDNADQYLKQKINIGNYTDSVKNALQQTGLFGGGLNKVSNVFNSFTPIFVNVKNELTQVVAQFNATTQATQGYTAAQKASAVATGGVSAALKIFRLALIATGIGAIVVVIGSLIAALKTSEEGQNRLNKILGIAGSIIGNLIDVFATFGEIVINAILKPQEAWENLTTAFKKGFDFVKGQVIDRFIANFTILFGFFEKGVLKLRIAWANFTGDADNAQALQNELDKVTKKVDEAADKINEKNLEVIKLYADAKDAVSGFVDELAKEAKAAADVADKRAKADKLERQLLVERSNLESKISELKLKSRQEDQFTAEERRKALIDAQALEDSLLASEVEVLELRRDAIQLENTFARSVKENLDEQAKAEAAVNNIVKQRNDLQRSTQRELNRVNNEVQKNAKAAQDAQIKQFNDEIKLLQEQRGFRARTLEEDLKDAEIIADKRLEVLKKELKLGRITRTEFEIESLSIENDLLERRANIVSEAAQKELDAYVEANQSKIDSDLFFSEQALQVEQDRLNAIAKRRREFAQKQLKEGVINQTQFNDAINKIDADNREKLDEAQEKRDEAQQEKELIDLENKRIAEDERNENQFVLEAERLERQRLLEVEAAIKTGADIKLINEKFAAFRETLENQVAEAKIQANQQSFDAIAGLLGQESALGKVAAIAAIVNNTVQESTKAFNTAAVLAANPLTAALAPNATIQGVKIIATGAANIAKTVSPKLKEGGIVGVGGKRHSQGGTKFVGEDGTTFEAEKGEGIGVLSRAAFDTFINFNNAFGSGKSKGGFFQGGGIISRAIPTQQDNNFELLRAIQNLPPPIVTVEDIRAGNQSFVEVASGANV